MLIGFNIPTSGPLATSETMTQLAVAGEAMGFSYATLSDHIVLPSSIDARYPYTETGEFPGRTRTEWQEQLTTIAFLAGKTSRLRFLTSVTVLPYRPAVLTAKILATIDVLSGGRLEVGCGAGWMREEFEAVSAPPYAERGAVTDEWLQAFVELWTTEKPRFDGRHVRFADIAFAPKPAQRPHPPLWIGGESGPAMRRAARLGTGWYPIGSNPKNPLDTLPRVRAAIERLRGLVAEAGREPTSVAVGYRCQRHGQLPQEGEGERRLFQGTPEQIASDLRAFRDLGITRVDFSFSGANAEATVANLRSFRESVLSAV